MNLSENWRRLSDKTSVKGIFAQGLNYLFAHSTNIYGSLLKCWDASANKINSPCFEGEDRHKKVNK